MIKKDESFSDFYIISTQSTQEAFLLLKFSRFNDFCGFGLHRRVVCRNWFAFLVALSFDILMMLGFVRMPHIGLIAVDEIRHCTVLLTIQLKSK